MCKRKSQKTDKQFSLRWNNKANSSPNITDKPTGCESEAMNAQISATSMGKNVSTDVTCDSGASEAQSRAGSISSKQAFCDSGAPSAQSRADCLGSDVNEQAICDSDAPRAQSRADNLSGDFTEWKNYDSCVIKD